MILPMGIEMPLPETGRADPGRASVPRTRAVGPARLRWMDLPAHHPESLAPGEVDPRRAASGRAAR